MRNSTASLCFTGSFAYMNKSILVLNLLFEDLFKTSFAKRIAESFQHLEATYEIINLDDLENITDFSRYTHLLISGSTESATAEKEWYPALDWIIHQFIYQEKSILGICFGHQFLIRHILGKKHVQKSCTPEIGWTEIELSDNPLFKEMGAFKSAVFHYDEVLNIGDQFEIIAQSNRCAIQGFQVKGKAIWGVQFHPDFIYQDVFKFAEIASENDAHFDDIHCQTATSYKEFRVNDQIFKNWIEIS